MSRTSVLVFIVAAIGSSSAAQPMQNVPPDPAPPDAGPSAHPGPGSPATGPRPAVPGPPAPAPAPSPAPAPAPAPAPPLAAPPKPPPKPPCPSPPKDEPAPTLTSITPSVGLASAAVDVTLRGSHFGTAATVLYGSEELTKKCAPKSLRDDEITCTLDKGLVPFVPIRFAVLVPASTKQLTSGPSAATYTPVEPVVVTSADVEKVDPAARRSSVQILLQGENFVVNGAAPSVFYDDGARHVCANALPIGTTELVCYLPYAPGKAYTSEHFVVVRAGERVPELRWLASGCM